MNKRKNDQDMDHAEKQYYRNPLDPDVTERKAIGETGKLLFKISVIFILPAIIILYVLYHFIGW